MIMFLTNWIFFITSVSNRKEDYSITQAYGCSHEDFENEIEDFSEEDVNQLDSESFNDSFDAGVIADNVGPATD